MSLEDTMNGLIDEYLRLTLFMDGANIKLQMSSETLDSNREIVNHIRSVFNWPFDVSGIYKIIAEKKKQDEKT